MATATNDKPVRLGDLPIIKTNILENARQYDKGVVGGYNGTFPLTAASQGGIYLVPATGKFYVCTDNYNGTQISAPNDKFVELSVWKNHDRLNNLIVSEENYIKFENGITIQFFSSSILTSGTQIIFPIAFIDTNYYVSIIAGTSSNVICSTTFSTKDKTKEHIKVFSGIDTGKADIIAIGRWK